ncbi:ATP-dependent DNA helicase, RecQ family [Terriglobus roseus DSM 18391]|uniref:ATP-dependent DNA helicase RecQ n=1 Tax=Terriglobus roseus (strain DSM 18391 / NRRL B-41598 / KBS 63) TaxID=926566 RepID=I3ZKP1_TERRK|nr:ATP-dependent DNA helicase RecQ [Terriglobus roseus]AFL89809.1 ATP-dependent DNA helicase, RecQ family [Terriglobus roseus DSM 18391]
MKKPVTLPSKAGEIPWAELKREAKKRFGISAFRSVQREVLESVLSGHDTLAIMPTGAGKSLTYQLPAMFLPHTVVVISPLIALMQDQQQKATDAGIAVTKIDSTLTKTEREAADNALLAGTPKLLYVTPERMQNAEFVAELKTAGVSLFVVDEAHTIAQWGHDFRPAYLGLRYARKELGNPPVLAVTATATDEVIQEILEQLDAKHARVISAGSERTNIYFAVHPTVNNDAKLARLTQMIASEKGSGIVYTASVKSANDLQERFTAAGIAAGRYHGKMNTRDREKAQADFMADKYKVMIATKAFGLGIDKPNIRFVFHYEFPDSLETYFQEAGRAGRDGQQANAVLLYRLEDRRIQSFFSAGRYPGADDLRKVLEALSAHDPVPAAQLAERAEVGKRRAEVILFLLRETKVVRRLRGGYVLRHDEVITDAHVATLLASYNDRAEHDRSRLDEMMRYAETADCRRKVFRRYFGEPEGERCGNCDNCINGTADTRSVVDLNAPEQSQGVTRVETLAGTIMTTAPEPLPHPAVDLGFKIGDPVQHKRFGAGKVMDLHDDTLLIRFQNAGTKKLKAPFVRHRK